MSSVGLHRPAVARIWSSWFTQNPHPPYLIKFHITHQPQVMSHDPGFQHLCLILVISHPLTPPCSLALIPHWPMLCSEGSPGPFSLGLFSSITLGPDKNVYYCFNYCPASFLWQDKLLKLKVSLKPSNVVPFTEARRNCWWLVGFWWQRRKRNPRLLQGSFPG